MNLLRAPNRLRIALHLLAPHLFHLVNLFRRPQLLRFLRLLHLPSLRLAHGSPSDLQ